MNYELFKLILIPKLMYNNIYEKDNIFDIIGYSDKQFMKDKR